MTNWLKNGERYDIFWYIINHLEYLRRSLFLCFSRFFSSLLAYEQLGRKNRDRQTDGHRWTDTDGRTERRTERRTEGNQLHKRVLKLHLVKVHSSGLNSLAANRNLTPASLLWRHSSLLRRQQNKGMQKNKRKQRSGNDAWRNAVRQLHSSSVVTNHMSQTNTHVPKSLHANCVADMMRVRDRRVSHPVKLDSAVRRISCFVVFQQVHS